MVKVHCSTCLGMYKTEMRTCLGMCTNAMCRCSTNLFFEMFFTMADIPWYWPDVSSSRLITHDLYLYDKVSE